MNIEFITLALKHEHLSEHVPLVYANVLVIQIEHLMRSWELYSWVACMEEQFKGRLRNMWDLWKELKRDKDVKSSVCLVAGAYRAHPDVSEG